MLGPLDEDNARIGPVGDRDQHRGVAQSLEIVDMVAFVVEQMVEVIFMPPDQRFLQPVAQDHEPVSMGKNIPSDQMPTGSLSSASASSAS